MVPIGVFSSSPICLSVCPPRYARVTTVRGSRFRFRGGDREATRKQVQSLFADLGPGVSAKVEDNL